MSGIIYPSFFDKSAPKMPYVYHDRPVLQYERQIYYRSPYLGINRAITFSPREEYGCEFDNVRGIKVNDKLIILREILFTGVLPGDIREISKQFSGRLPNEEEIKVIYNNRASICNNLLEMGEQPLLSDPYLFHKEESGTDYCLNFSTGEMIIVDCDDCVAALLVA